MWRELEKLERVASLLGGRPSEWSVREIGDGNLNLVFVVCGPSGSVIVKQALPYVRLVGDSWPLPLERAGFERDALEEQERHAPGFVPHVHHFDPDLHFVVMEHLTPHIILRQGLVRGRKYPRAASDLAVFVARTLFFTSPLGSSAAACKKRVERFAPNTELCRVTEDLVFTDPYREAPLNRWNSPALDAAVREVRADAALKIAVQECKHQFITRAEALVHGDLHTGSVMVTQDSTKVIDPEFAFVGPIGFDVGAVIANLLLSYFAHGAALARPAPDDHYSAWILTQCEAFWSRFEVEFLGLWRTQASDATFSGEILATPSEKAAMERFRAGFMQRLLADSLAFAGCKMIRRIIGLAHVADLESIEDPSVRAVAERRAIRLARELATSPGAFGTISEATNAARDLVREIQ